MNRTRKLSADRYAASTVDPQTLLCMRGCIERIHKSAHFYLDSKPSSLVTHNSGMGKRTLLRESFFTNDRLRQTERMRSTR